MARLFPSKSVTVDQRDGTHVLVTKVTLQTTADDYIVLPAIIDAANLLDSSGETDPTFYIAGGSNGVGWLSGTVNEEYTVCSTHSGINFQRGAATGDSPK